MLVFQLNWDHLEGANDEFDKGCRRAGIEPAWLVEMVAEINLYLPDDWRMTRSTNNFRLQLVTQEHNVTLVGFAYRTRGGRILNIVDSVHPKGFSDNVDSGLHLGAPGKVQKPPRAAAPNVYFFKPAPENSASPLFARQYEKVLKRGGSAEADNQYHRIHPLTPAGLDLTRFRWVRWTRTGEVEFVETVDPGYHGKDYWVVKPLTAAGRRATRERYIDCYHEILQRFAVNPPPSPQKSHGSYEVEHKLLVPGGPGDAEALFDMLQEASAYQDTGFSIIGGAASARRQIDTYFDDDLLSLHRIGASFRIRKKDKDNVLLTLKKRVPAFSVIPKEGLYERIEEEVVLNSCQERDLRSGKEIGVFPYLLLAYVAPQLGVLKPKVVVANQRKVVALQDRRGRAAEVCLDTVTYEFEGWNRGMVYHEVEIESRGAARDAIDALAKSWEQQYRLVPSRQSKYERGISLLRTAPRPVARKMVIIDTDCGVDDALALILALKSPELDVQAITTVSGNVSVDKVVPNVFKVYDALGIHPGPPVLVGASCALEKIRNGAESVHGTDGLGDCIPTPALPNLDPRPAWRFICEMARLHPKQITLITVGPMTNLALAIRNDPQSVSCLKEVVAMGGVFFDVGNVGADMEFNVWADPDAAREVTRFCRDSSLQYPVDREGNRIALPPNPGPQDFAGVKAFVDHDPADPAMLPLTYVGLDVTHKVMLRRSTLDRVVKAYPGNTLLRFVQSISRKYMDFYYRNEGLEGCYLHDPLAVAYVINPMFLEVEKHIIHVETLGSFTSGMIFPDDRPTTNWAWRNPAEKVIGVARRVETEAFEEFFLNRIMDSSNL